MEAKKTSTAKEKLKHLPYNLLIYSPNFGLYMLITSMLKIDIYISLLISFYLYFSNVANNCDKDYLEERIKKLEDKK